MYGQYGQCLYEDYRSCQCKERNFAVLSIDVSTLNM